MPNIGKLLKDEIARIARKESKVAVTPLRKPSVAARRTLADLKKRIAALEKETKKLTGLLADRPAACADGDQPEETGRVRVTVKGVKSLRRKLGMSQDEFARLLGVSGQAIYLWERKSGALRLRQTTKKALLAVRDLGAKEARARLEQMDKAKSARKPAAKRGRRK